MSLPLWLPGLGIALWFVEVGFPWLGAVAGLLLAAPQWVRVRWAVSDAEFRRAFDLCWVLAAGGLLLSYNREPVGGVLRLFATWLPLVLLPAILVQAWSETGRVPVAAILPLPAWRRRHPAPSRALDAGPPFLALCLLSMSLAGQPQPSSYLGLACLAALALWAVRNRTRRPILAAGFLLLATASGWFVASGVADFQSWIENRLSVWAERWRRDDGTERMARTAIGRNGRVGGSGRVVFSVRATPNLVTLPLRYRVATYSTWRDGVWYAPGNPPERIEGAADEWPLDATVAREGSVRLELRTALTGGLLALPSRTAVVGELAADAVERTGLGTVRPRPEPGMLAYRADLAEASAWETAPTDEDRRGVPPHERQAVASVLAELGLAGREPGEAIALLARFFQRAFHYTTDLRDEPATDPRATTAIGRFLLGHRSGHCEYFATAAVLLLRAGGIPARYATGYRLDTEGPPAGEVWLPVRERDAHAWVQVWHQGRWHEFDPTPPSALPEPALSSWERRWADLRFHLLRWWWLGEKRLLRQAYWLTLPLLALMLWRLGRLRRARGQRGTSGRAEAPPARTWPGMDSEWYAVAKELAARGWLRHSHESRANWRERLAGGMRDRTLADRTADALTLHERLRFDPLGLGATDRLGLRESAHAVLTRIDAPK